MDRRELKQALGRLLGPAEPEEVTDEASVCLATR